MTDLPVVPLAGSEGWANAYETGQALDARFPGQDADELTYACEYNDEGPTAQHAITSLVMEQQGDNDGQDWVWLVGLADGSTWRATGGCDYTGWDCQSWLDWGQLPVVVPDTMPSGEANITYGESYGVDWVYESKEPDDPLAKVREARQLLADEFGHAEAQYNPNALRALALLNEVLA